MLNDNPDKKPAKPSQTAPQAGSGGMTPPPVEERDARLENDPEAPTSPSGADLLATLLQNPLVWVVALVGITLAVIGMAALQNRQAQSTPPPTSPSTSLTEPTSTPVLMSDCTVVSTMPTPGPTEQSLFPDVSPSDWVRGAPTASVTIVEYSDFQCPFCARIAPVLARLEQEYPNDVRVVFRHFPLLSIHDKAALATQAAEAAGMQGKFWEMHDLLFGRQAEWSSLPAEDFKSWVIARAGELGLDQNKFTADLTSAQAAAVAQKGWEEGQKIGIPGTPFLLVNRRIWPNTVPMDYTNLVAVIKLTLLEKKQFTYCPPMIIDPLRQYTATLHTVKGDIVLELFADKAPLAVNNFVFLARQGWYDGVTFHRVIPGFVAQAGDPTGTGFGGPGYAFKNETSPDLVFDREGLLAMANAGPDSNGSQFFITYAPAENLNGGYTIFGQVISGMEVVKALTPRDPSKNANLPPGDVIQSVIIEEK